MNGCDNTDLVFSCIKISSPEWRQSISLVCNSKGWIATQQECVSMGTQGILDIHPMFHRLSHAGIFLDNTNKDEEVS